jgi:predicted Fe-Mo cluster-binding NifX family protein
MKIAFPTADGEIIFPHFGRTPNLKIFDLEDNKVISERIVSNTFTGHSQGLHNEKDHEHHQHHSHEGIMSALKGCDIVIANGMGRRLLEDFQKANITVYVTQEQSIVLALEKFTSNALDHNPNSCCSH